MAFVTPWNKGGYDRAVKFAKKLDYISPAWYTLKAKEVEGNRIEPVVEGESNVDADFL